MRQAFTIFVSVPKNCCLVPKVLIFHTPRISIRYKQNHWEPTKAALESIRTDIWSKPTEMCTDQQNYTLPYSVHLCRPLIAFKVLTASLQMNFKVYVSVSEPFSASLYLMNKSWNQLNLPYHIKSKRLKSTHSLSLTLLLNFSLSNCEEPNTYQN